MYFKKIITTIIFSIILCGCGKTIVEDNSSEVINVNPYDAEEYILLSEIVDSVKCIKLQINPDDIMGRVLEVIVKKKYIYALDVSQKMVFVFDKEGKFVSKLAKKGEGSDEYTSMGPIFIDDNEEYIELINWRGNKTAKLKYSNISFELIESVPFPDVVCNSLKRNDSNYYFATQQLDNVINGKKTNAGLVIFDDKGNMKTLFNKNIETKHSSFSPNSESFTKNDKNELFISLMYDNTFYRIEAGVAHPVFTVDFGKYGINNKIGLRPMQEQMEYIQKVNDLASFPVLNMNNSNIMSFSYYFKQDKAVRMYREEDFRQYIKIKQNNKIYHTKKIKNDITDFPSYIYISSYFFVCNHDVWYENYLVDIFVPNYRFFNSETEKIFVDGIGEITADDDPIVVLMKLKDSLSIN
jgi:hypothetical protein